MKCENCKWYKKDTPITHIQMHGGFFGTKYNKTILEDRKIGECHFILPTFRSNSLPAGHRDGCWREGYIDYLGTVWVRVTDDDFCKEFVSKI